MMRHLLGTLLLLLASLCSSSVLAQQALATYSKVKVFFSEDLNIADLAALGLEADHGIYERGRSLINIFSETEMALIRQAGFDYEVLVEDMTAHYLEHQHDQAPAEERMVDCQGPADPTVWTTPANYTFGSMGGYHTWDEMLVVLDDMVSKYPNLITMKQSISDTLLSHEGRPIYWLRISDNPNMDEEEPEVLYTSLHHAREPNSLSQTLFFMWYLLENYETDAEVKYLVDNSALYFVPCVNPDGYVFNESTNPDGGGFWRKNRRDNGNGTFGVDLNRNYGFQWGINNSGSSPSSDSDVYRGESPFSEPETRALKLFCETHDFQIALNAHTFSRLLIYPWGYNDQETADSLAFRNISRLMTEENNYVAGLGIETVGYAVNGVSDDWMYGDQGIISMTPEVGPSFWPNQNQIDDLNKEMMLTNLMAVRVLHQYGQASDLGDIIITDTEGTIPLEVQRLGLKDGPLELRLDPISPNITSTSASMMFNLDAFASEEVELAYEISPTTIDGEEVLFLVSVGEDGLVWTDTIRRIYNTSTLPSEIIFEEAANNVFQWITNAWGLTASDFVSPPFSLADSPQGNYPSNAFSALTTRDPINLTNALKAKLVFKTRWEIEQGWDYVQILATTDGQNFTPLCGRYSKLGNENQDEGQPLYDGAVTEWVEEEIDLSEYIGTFIFLRFQLISDGFLEQDGFYFDDLEV
ncbi:MAG: M14 family zinc carboxypeptidase, partial [Bacteroidota bacterium]